VTLQVLISIGLSMQYTKLALDHLPIRSPRVTSYDL